MVRSVQEVAAMKSIGLVALLGLVSVTALLGCKDNVQMTCRPETQRCGPIEGGAGGNGNGGRGGAGGGGGSDGGQGVDAGDASAGGAGGADTDAGPGPDARRDAIRDAVPDGSDEYGCCPPDSIVTGCMHLGGYSETGVCYTTCDFWCSTNWRLETDSHGCRGWRYDNRAPRPGETSACLPAFDGGGYEIGYETPPESRPENDAGAGGDTSAGN